MPNATITDLAGWFRAMRIQRGVSQHQLADSAGVSHFTAGRAETKQASALKPLTLAQLFVGLHRLAPINAADKLMFLDLSGLSAEALHVAGYTAAPLSAAAGSLDVPNEAIEIVARLIASFGSAQTIAMLRDWATSVGARVSKSAAPGSVRVQWPAEGGFVITEHIPVNKPAAPAIPARRAKHG